MAIEVEQLRVVVETNARAALRELVALHEQMLKMGRDGGKGSSVFGTREQMRIAKEQMLGEVKAANAALREEQAGEARRIQRMTTEIALQGVRAQARKVAEEEKLANSARYRAQQDEAQINRDRLRQISQLEVRDYQEAQRRITNSYKEEARKQREIAVEEARGRNAGRERRSHGGGGGFGGFGGGIAASAIGGAGIAAFGAYEGVKSSIDKSAAFQADMLRSSSLAGLDKSQIPRYSDAILKLSAQVGESPVKLADALYHQLSVLPANMSKDARFKTAIEGVKVSALGAGIGGGDIVQTQLALNAGMAAGGTDQKALMNLALRTVGAGDMTLANYTAALSNGALGVGKAYGAKDTEIGAFLALLGDNNIRGSAAGTQVKMSLQSLTQVAGKNGGKGNPWLGALGIGGNEKRFSDDLAKGGMDLALSDLHDLLLKSGYTGQSTAEEIQSGNFKNHSMGQVITGLFGKRAGIGITLAEQQFNTGNTNWKDKLNRVGSSDASGFDKDSAAYKNTTEFKMKSFHGAMDAFKVKAGDALIPVVTALLPKLAQGLQYLSDHIPQISAFFRKMWADLQPIVNWLRAHAEQFKHAFEWTAGHARLLLGVGLLSLAFSKAAGPASALLNIVSKLSSLGAVGGFGGPSQKAANAAKREAEAKAAKHGERLNQAMNAASGAGYFGKRRISKDITEDMAHKARMARHAEDAKRLKFGWNTLKEVGGGGLNVVSTLNDFRRAPRTVLKDGLKSGRAGLGRLGGRGLGRVGEGALHAAAHPLSTVLKTVEKTTISPLKMMGKSVGKFAGLLTMIPFGVWVVALAAIGGALFLAYKHSAKFREGIHHMVTVVVAAFHHAVAAVKAWAHAHEADFHKVGQQLGKLGHAFSQIFGALKHLVTSVLHAFGGAMDSHGKKTTDWSKVLFQAIGFVIATLTFLAKVVAAVVNAIASYWDHGGKNIVKGVIDVFVGVYKIIKGVLEVVIGIVKFFWDIMHGHFSAAGKDLKLIVQGLADVVVGIFTGLGKSLWNIGKGIVQGLIGGIMSMAGGLKDAVKTGIIDLLPNPVQKALGINSPSRVFHTIGTNVVAGLVGGITGGKPLVGATMRDFSDLVVLKTGKKFANTTMEQFYKSITEGSLHQMNGDQRAFGGGAAHHGHEGPSISLHIDHLHLGSAGTITEARALGDAAVDQMLHRLTQQTVGKTAGRRFR